MRARDITCIYPRCQVPARRCDIDHRLAWTDGGTTTVTNLHCLCRAHHRAKHLGGFSYEPALGGIVWTMPGGQRYVKPDRTPPGYHRQEQHVGPVIIDLTGYTHTPGPPPRLRQ